MTTLVARCAATLLAWSALVVAGMFALGASRDPFFAVGPTGQNQVFMTKIDNWGLYWAIMAYQVASACLTVVNLEVVLPAYVAKNTDAPTLHAATSATICFTAVTALVGIRLQMCQVDFFFVGLACNMGAAHAFVHACVRYDAEGPAAQPLLST